MEPWLNSLISAVAGGLVTALLAPYIKWDIEKRALRRKQRIERIAFWRAEIDASDDFKVFLNTLTFKELSKYFSTQELEEFDGHWSAVYQNKSTSWDRGKLLKFHEVVLKLEKEWRLI